MIIRKQPTAQAPGVADVPNGGCYHVASVVLNFNSDSDLFESVPQLATQKGLTHSLIIVDNASYENCVQRIKSWLLDWHDNVVSGTLEEIEAWLSENKSKAQTGGSIFFVLNKVNSGYSAGNNIGIRLADALDADAVLIANPDIRIEDPHYLSELTKQLFANEQNYVAASRIVGLDGKDQNPLREPSFWEELFWPRVFFSQFLKPISYVVPISDIKPVRVHKVSGCCLLLRMSYLKVAGYLDEGVFLYCEEPILASRVHSTSGYIVFVPSISAVHAHVRSEKGNSSRRMLLFIKSRRYYLDRYSGYSRWQRRFLGSSYWVLNNLHKLMIHIGRDK